MVSCTGDRQTTNALIHQENKQTRDQTSEDGYSSVPRKMSVFEGMELRLSIWRRSWSWRLPARLHEPGQIGPLPEVVMMTSTGMV
jgi:hypothetical protein